MNNPKDTYGKRQGGYVLFNDLRELRDGFEQNDLGALVYEYLDRKTNDFLGRTKYKAEYDFHCLDDEKEVFEEDIEGDCAKHSLVFRYSFDQLAPAYAYSSDISIPITFDDMNDRGFIPVFSLLLNNFTAMVFADDTMDKVDMIKSSDKLRTEIMNFESMNLGQLHASYFGVNRLHCWPRKYVFQEFNLSNSRSERWIIDDLVDRYFKETWWKVFDFDKTLKSGSISFFTNWNYEWRENELEVEGKSPSWRLFDFYSDIYKPLSVHCKEFGFGRDASCSCNNRGKKIIHDAKNLKVSRGERLLCKLRPMERIVKTKCDNCKYKRRASAYEIGKMNRSGEKKFVMEGITCGSCGKIGSLVVGKEFEPVVVFVQEKMRKEVEESSRFVGKINSFRRSGDYTKDTKSGGRNWLSYVIKCDDRVDFGYYRVIKEIFEKFGNLEKFSKIQGIDASNVKDSCERYNIVFDEFLERAFPMLLLDREKVYFFHPVLLLFLHRLLQLEYLPNHGIKSSVNLKQLFGSREPESLICLCEIIRESQDMKDKELEDGLRYCFGKGMKMDMKIVRDLIKEVFISLELFLYLHKEMQVPE